MQQLISSSPETKDRKTITFNLRHVMDISVFLLCRKERIIADGLYTRQIPTEISHEVGIEKLIQKRNLNL